MTSSIFSDFLKIRLTALPLLLLSPALFQNSFAQSPTVLTVAPPDRIEAKIGTTVQAKLSVDLKTGYHCNSDKPNDEYLIPLKLTWTAGSLEAVEVIYPKPQLEHYGFQKPGDKPMSVYTGAFELITKFKVSASATPGPATVTGKLRYQACNDRMCLQPKTIEVTQPVDIVK